MKVLMVSWEYPPVVVGGLGRHVHHLATHLAQSGHDVVVLARREMGTDASTHPTTDTVTEGVRVVAVAEDSPHVNFAEDMLAWTLAMGHAMVRAGLDLGRTWQPDVVHAHDWLVAHPAIALAQHFDAPLVATMHATEAGRHSGWVSGKVNRQVHSVEWWLAQSADALIACSTSMGQEVSQLFGPGLGPVSVIHNGIDTSTWTFRERAPRQGAPCLFFAGRLEYEKGVQDAIAALAKVRRTHPGTTLAVAGEGTQQTWLTEQARAHKVVRSVRFLGKLNHDQLLGWLHGCDAMLLPSRYEPFGIVALEAAAAGAPLVASTAGGLGEAVVDGVSGRSFAPGDVAGLAEAIRLMLNDPAQAQRMANTARTRLGTEFAWEQVAASTAAVYRAALQAGPRHTRLPHGRPVVPLRPLPGR